MRVLGLPRAFYRVGRFQFQELSPKARERLRYLRCFEALREQGLSSTRASKILSLPRATLFRWQRRLKEQGPQGLEERSRRPRRCQPTWSVELAQAVLRLREQYPRWGKDKPFDKLRTNWWCCCAGRAGRSPPLWLDASSPASKPEGCSRSHHAPASRLVGGSGYAPMPSASPKTTRLRSQGTWSR